MYSIENYRYGVVVAFVDRPMPRKTAAVGSESKEYAAPNLLTANSLFSILYTMYQL